jgi:hypothetical protein
MASTILNVASQRRPGTSRLKGNRPLQQLRQPGDVDSYTPRLIAREQPRGGTAAGLVLIIDIAELECRQCGALRKGGEACGHCGFQPKRRPEAILFAEGELTEVRNGKAKPAYSHDDRQRWYQQLMALRLVRNEDRASNGKEPLKPQWAAAQFKDKFGSWPPFDWNSLPPAAAVSPEIKSWVRSRDIAYAKARQNVRAA